MPPAGAKILVPGLAHTVWGQHGHAIGFFFGFVASSTLAYRSWGTTAGLIALIAAFAIHVASVADALRQNASPGLSRGAAWLGVAFGLALGLYGPLLVSSSFFEGLEGASSNAASVWIGTQTDPGVKDAIWYLVDPDDEAKVGQIAAVAGDEVKWKSGRLYVNNQPSSAGNPLRSSSSPDDLTYRVPKGHVLVQTSNDPGGDGGTPKRPGEAFVIVPDGQVVGRDWPRMHPKRASQSIQ